MSEIVYLNGAYRSVAEACVPVLDRGFLFGDGIYEVIPVYGGRLFALTQHLERLQRSLQAVDIPNPHDEDEWREIFDQLISRNKRKDDLAIYLQLTRGVMQKRDHNYGPDLEPTVLAMCQAARFVSSTMDTPGIKAITVNDNRWDECHIKSINLLPNILLKQQATRQDAGESILIREGLVIEGSTSNLFIVKDDIIKTPPKSRHMLGGIMRELVLDICQQNKILAQEKKISEDELHDADEIWITSSTREIMPVTWLNQHKVGSGKPGPGWRQLIELYQQYKQDCINAQA